MNVKQRAYPEEGMRCAQTLASEFRREKAADVLAVPTTWFQATANALLAAIMGRQISPIAAEASNDQENYV